MNEHVAGEDLAAYVDGKLKGKRQNEVESHLSRCPECLEALADIVDVQGSRVRIPGEFLNQALGEKHFARKPAAPLRLVLEIAAVFLVVVFIGYFFLSGNRFWEPRDVQKEKAVATLENPVSQLPPAEDGKAIQATARRANDAEADRARKTAVEKMAMPEPAPPRSPEDPSAGAAAAKDQETAPIGKSEILMPGKKSAEAAAVPLQEEETDKLGTAQSDRSLSAAAPESAGVSPPVVAAKAQFAQPGGKGREVPASLSSRAEGMAPGGRDHRREQSLRLSAAAAVQLFVAATGRATGPLGLDATALAPPPRFGIEGDVAWTDLRDPWLLDDWSWFREGMVLELEIDGAGSVTAVKPLGPWGNPALAAVAKAARQLVFSASKRRIRLARISVSGASPN